MTAVVPLNRCLDSGNEAQPTMNFICGSIYQKFEAGTFEFVARCVYSGNKMLSNERFGLLRRTLLLPTAKVIR